MGRTWRRHHDPRDTDLTQRVARGQSGAPSVPTLVVEHLHAGPELAGWVGQRVGQRVRQRVGQRESDENKSQTANTR